MLHRILSRRALATAAIAIAASIGSVAGVSLADGTGPTPALSTASPPPAQPSGILAGVQQVLAGLVADGTIDQQQANAVQTQANAGSIDPKQLVQSPASASIAYMIWVWWPDGSPELPNW